MPVFLLAFTSSSFVHFHPCVPKFPVYKSMWLYKISIHLDVLILNWLPLQRGYSHIQSEMERTWGFFGSRESFSRQCHTSTYNLSKQSLTLHIYRYQRHTTETTLCVPYCPICSQHWQPQLRIALWDYLSYRSWSKSESHLEIYLFCNQLSFTCISISVNMCLPFTF